MLNNLKFYFKNINCYFKELKTNFVLHFVILIKKCFLWIKTCFNQIKKNFQKILKFLNFFKNKTHNLEKSYKKKNDFNFINSECLIVFKNLNFENDKDFINYFYNNVDKRKIFNNLIFERNAYLVLLKHEEKLNKMFSYDTLNEDQYLLYKLLKLENKRKRKEHILNFLNIYITCLNEIKVTKNNYEKIFKKSPSLEIYFNIKWALKSVFLRFSGIFAIIIYIFFLFIYGFSLFNISLFETNENFIINFFNFIKNEKIFNLMEMKIFNFELNIFFNLLISLFFFSLMYHIVLSLNHFFFFERIKREIFSLIKRFFFVLIFLLILIFVFEIVFYYYN